MKLWTTDDEYQEAMAALDRRKGKTITLPRDLFAHLAIDHSRMVRQLDSMGDKCRAMTDEEREAHG